jgi:large subunit ribosomal protein L21
MAVAKTTAKKAVAKKAPTKAAAKKPVSDEFAVILTGGKQYQVSVGDVVTIEKMKEEHKKGDIITFDKVLLVDNGSDTTIGTPHIDGATVTGEVTVVGRAQKVTVIKYKQKSRYFKKNGHRQPYLKVSITAIK